MKISELIKELQKVQEEHGDIESCYQAGDGWYNWSKDYYEIKSSLFPEVQWSDDEPTKVKLEIVK